MKRFFQGTRNTTSDKRLKKRILLISSTILLALLFAGQSPKNVYAASKSRQFKIYDYKTKKKIKYTDKRVRILYASKQIHNDKTFGILSNGIAMVPYLDVFKKSPIKADCVYHKKTNSVTIAKNGISIVMKVNKKQASVNGKTMKMPLAPVKIKYLHSKATRILVPSRFVSETLGLGYTWNSKNSTVNIQKSSLTLSYNGGSKFEYEGIKGKVTVDGKPVELGSMPSLLVNNNAMISAKKVFADSKMGTKYAYDKQTKTITLSNDKKKLVMTIGSKNALLNGKGITLDCKPILVKNYDKNSTFVMVPGNLTASSLGYHYTWDRAKKTSVITTKGFNIPSVNTQSEDVSTHPYLVNNTSDHIETPDAGTILRQWSTDNATYAKAGNTHELNTNGTDKGNEVGTIVGFTKKKDNIKNAETYIFTSSKPFGKVTSRISNKVLSLLVSNMYSYDQDYPKNKPTGLVDHVGTKYDVNCLTTKIDIGIVPDHISYDLSLSDDRKNLFVTVYQNCITSAVIGTKQNSDFVTLTGIDALQVTVTKQDHTLLLDLPEVINVTGDCSTKVTGARYLKQYTINSLSGKSQILLELDGKCEYTVSTKENQYTLILSAKDNGANSNQESESTDYMDRDYEIIIPKPDKADGIRITDADYYNKKQFAIMIDGDYTDFFHTHPVKLNSKLISDVSVRLDENSRTEIRFTTTTLQGYTYVKDQNNIYVHIGNPREIYSHIVVLDAGHGGNAAGARYFGVKEKDLNLKILYDIGRKYFNADSNKLKVYYTRSTDVDMSLSDRAAFASKVGADLFVSLHMNASTSSSPRGTEVYYSDNNNKANDAGLTSKMLASMFADRLAQELGTTNRGCRAQKYTVVHRNTVPAVLIELGFMSNESDINLLTNNEFQENAARTIYDTINEVFDTYPTNR